MRTAQPHIAFAVCNDALPALVRKTILIVEIHYSVFVCTAQAFFATKPHCSGTVYAYSAGGFICKPADAVGPTRSAGLHQRKPVGGSNINPVCAIGSQAASTDDFHRLSQIDDFQMIAAAAGKRLAGPDPESAIC